MRNLIRMYKKIQKVHWTFGKLKKCNVSITKVKFYVYVSVHRSSILIVVRRDATKSSLFIILQVHSTCFGCQPHPSSGVHKTVTTSSGTAHISCAPTSLQRGQASLATLHETCRVSFRTQIAFVASRWTTSNIKGTIFRSVKCLWLLSYIYSTCDSCNIIPFTVSACECSSIRVANLILKTDFKNRIYQITLNEVTSCASLDSRCY